ncbi:MAG TPA: hypothetical protein VMB21_03615 [Candidatus Limnocylindria bacterium]|jgi:lipopolysaccharide export system protein LptA|nr:hypothetical protein [Candidatus Limnocylindria bacterium]
MKLRSVLPLFLLLLPAAPHAEEMAADEIELTGEQIVIEPKTGNAHAWGNVHLVQPGVLDLRSEDFVFRQGTNALGKRIVEEIVATTNVVLLTIQPLSTNRAVSFQAVFNGGNNSLRLTGSPETGLPRYEMPEGVITGTVLTYDRASGDFRSEQGFHLKMKAGVLKNSSLFGPKTNSPSAK